MEKPESPQYSSAHTAWLDARFLAAASFVPGKRKSWGDRRELGPLSTLPQGSPAFRTNSVISVLIRQLAQLSEPIID